MKSNMNFNNLGKAIELCKDPKKFEDFSEGLKIFDTLILDTSESVPSRIKTFLALLKIAPDQAYDKLSRVRDSLSFYCDSQLDTYDEKKADIQIKFIREVCVKPQLNSQERATCAICLYNNGYIEFCFPLFDTLLNDLSMLIDYRIECARFLLYSEVPEYENSAKEILLSIIDTKDYPSQYRYNVIAGFITTTGLASMLSREKLNVVYDEKFLYQMQMRFFWNKTINRSQERILSGQHLLDMKIISSEDKNKIVDELLDIAKNFSIEDDIKVEVVRGKLVDLKAKEEEGDVEEEDQDRLREEYVSNVKADALDVILRLGTDEQKDIARRSINVLGYSHVNGKKIKNLREKVKGVYNDAQNVHDKIINKSVQEFICNKLLKLDPDENVDSYQTVSAEINDYIYKCKLLPKNRIKAFKSLNRISIDTATFSEKNITTAEIFVHVWRIIKKQEEAQREELKKRMIDELIDMSDTCSSGHSSRLINVLSGSVFELKISWEDQLHSNMAARMQKKIDEIKDSKLQEQVVLGMDVEAEPDQKDTFIKFVLSEIESLKEELRKEFVGEGYIDNQDFEKYFETGTRNWID